MLSKQLVRSKDVNEYSAPGIVNAHAGDPVVKRLKVSHDTGAYPDSASDKDAEVHEWESIAVANRCRDPQGYVKLVNRPRFSSYELKCSSLSEEKQQVLKRNLELRMTAKATDPEFHKTMQQFGSCL
jgi:hypothetical protein